MQPEQITLTLGILGYKPNPDNFDKIMKTILWNLIS